MGDGFLPFKTFRQRGRTTLNQSARSSISTGHPPYAADPLSKLPGKGSPMAASQLALTAISSRPTLRFKAGIGSNDVLISGQSPG
jgi:hypothetical protein